MCSHVSTVLFLLQVAINTTAMIELSPSSWLVYPSIGCRRGESSKD